MCLNNRRLQYNDRKGIFSRLVIYFYERIIWNLYLILLFPVCFVMQFLHFYKGNVINSEKTGRKHEKPDRDR